MARLREKIILSWSGGKDSALALWDIRKSGHFDVVGLVTIVTEPEERVTMHGVSRGLIEQQAHAMDLPVHVVHVPTACPNDLYVERVNVALRKFVGTGIRKIAFGDVYLDDMRDFREEHLDAIGMEAIFPLWHRDTKELSYAFINAKFKAILTTVDGTVLDKDFAGRTFDRGLLSDLPITVDPCGENGEFHTFVYDGPTFLRPVPVKIGLRHSCARFHYCDLAPKAALVKTS